MCDGDADLLRRCVEAARREAERTLERGKASMLEAARREAAKAAAAIVAAQREEWMEDAGRQAQVIAETASFQRLISDRRVHQVFEALMHGFNSLTGEIVGRPMRLYREPMDDPAAYEDVFVVSLVLLQVFLKVRFRRVFSKIGEQELLSILHLLPHKTEVPDWHVLEALHQLPIRRYTWRKPEGQGGPPGGDRKGFVASGRKMVFYGMEDFRRFSAFMSRCPRVLEDTDRVAVVNWDYSGSLLYDGDDEPPVKRRRGVAGVVHKCRGLPPRKAAKELEPAAADCSEDDYSDTDGDDDDDGDDEGGGFTWDSAWPSEPTECQRLALRLAKLGPPVTRLRTW